MNSVGIDLHRNRSQIAVIDRNGELSLSRRIVNDRATFLELLAGLEGESRIAVEATYGWEWLAEQFLLKADWVPLYPTRHSGRRQRPFQ
jgi:hypothetical protein